MNDTLLHSAAACDSTSCHRVLLRLAPHHLEAVDAGNNTPLMYAVMFDNRYAAMMLLGAGADVRAKNDDDNTVFDIARTHDYEEMLIILNQHQQVSGILYFNSLVQ